ncbi:putative peroxidase [Helianthus annuus]|nr:putative peroxidase [Helianthus annuus]KAJ0530165.1 putative peroxidase [Helianthus annuus]KAJ0697028.1 putative peroxidase [Helianthus annuus]
MEASSLSKTGILLVLLLAILTNFALGQGYRGTRVGFYKSTCPRVESIVQSAVESAVRANQTIAPGLLRMFFHDCFINGCDASILINGSSTEKSAGPNAFLRGFEVIDAAKSQLEKDCPGVVSCSDILALAARDSVVLTGGHSWQVPLGRRDGLVSRGSDTANLPASNDSISVQIKKFADKGLDIQDLVTLVGKESKITLLHVIQGCYFNNHKLNWVLLSIGGHTIGTAACGVFSYRLYNFNNTNRPDPDINSSFLPQLRALCPNGGNASRRVALDTGSVNSFGESFYANLKYGRGVIESDAKLWSDPTTQRFVKRFLGSRGLHGLRFDVEFGRAMVKMGNVEVKTGKQGEIRRICTAIN